LLELLLDNLPQAVFVAGKEIIKSLDFTKVFLDISGQFIREIADLLLDVRKVTGHDKPPEKDKRPKWAKKWANS
jgi:hypothetical protein